MQLLQIINISRGSRKCRSVPCINVHIFTTAVYYRTFHWLKIIDVFVSFIMMCFLNQSVQALLDAYRSTIYMASPYVSDARRVFIHPFSHLLGIFHMSKLNSIRAQVACQNIKNFVSSDRTTVASIR